MTASDRTDESGRHAAATAVAATEAPVNILLVDDRPENLVALEAILASPEHRLVTATSGSQALRSLLQHEFAVILLDVVMPDMDGFELARLIRAREPSAHAPIIFLTAGSSDLPQIYRGYSVGAVDYLVKPVEPDVVRAKVSVFVELFRNRMQIREQADLLRRAEARERARELRELAMASEQRYRNLAESIPHVVWTARPDGCVEYFNERWYQFTGLAVDQSTGWSWLLALHPDDRTAFVELWRDAIRQGSNFEHECRLRAWDGNYRWHLCRALPERNAADALVAWLGTYTDIDDLKRAEHERARLYAEAKAGVRVRDEFLSVASHELKTPITALQLHLRNFARIVTRETTLAPERVVPRIQSLERSVSRLTRLIDNLLDISRITAGRIDLVRERVDLAALTRDAVERAREELPRSAPLLSVEVEEHVVGDWDSVRVEQVLTNLISNAVKYGGGKPVEVLVEREGNVARLTVRDRGIGIAPEHQARIFERFERAVADRQYNGLGLGLWIVRQIVEAHGGAIRVESAPGSGSTFRVELPMDPVIDASEPARVVRPAPDVERAEAE